MTRWHRHAARQRLPLLLALLSAPFPALFPALLVSLFLGCASAARADGPQSDTAAELRRQYRQLEQSLAASTLGRPLVLDSVETEGGLRGDVYAVLERPVGELRAALAEPAAWCELLLLHIDNRRCRVRLSGGADVLLLSVVRRHDKPVEDAFELRLVRRTLDASDQHLAVEFASEDGPLGTRRHRVLLEVVALGERRSFVRFGYAYEHHAMARLATMAYLATFGSHKVGFSASDPSSGGTAEPVRGLRGLVERNAMRYFLALDAYLADAGGPPAERPERRQRRWYASIEAYPRQLHEVDLDTYLALKRADRERDAGMR